MTRKETVLIITLLATNYDSFANKTQTDEQVKVMLDIWQECLADLDYTLVLQAVKKTIIQSAYTPTIFDIRKNAIEMSTPKTNILTPVEAWNEAYVMICEGLYMKQEEFEKASPEVRKFFGNVRQVKELAQTDINVVNTVTKGQFLKQYEVLVNREKEQKLLPQEMKNFINKLGKCETKTDKKVLES